MPDLTDLMQTDNRFVAKWGNKLFAIGDYRTTQLPTDGAEYFGADHLPLAPPTGLKVMGYITTDGITASREISSTETEMDQDTEPVREDIEKDAMSLAVTFGESNAWTNALHHGLSVAEWPAQKDGPWFYGRGDLVDPEYVGLILAQDGAGVNAKYRIEAAHRLKPNSFGDRALARRTAEQFQFGFKVLKDPTTGESLTRGQDGPFYYSTPTEPEPTP